jgi:phosphotransferase system IIA component
MNEGSALLNIALNGKGTYNNVKWSIKDQKGNIICQYDAKLQNNKYSVNIPTVYVKKIQNKEYFIDSKPF